MLVQNSLTKSEPGWSNSESNRHSFAGVNERNNTSSFGNGPGLNAHASCCGEIPHGQAGALSGDAETFGKTRTQTPEDAQQVIRHRI